MIATIPGMLVRYAALKEFKTGYNKLVIHEAIKICTDNLILNGDSYVAPIANDTILPVGTVIIGPDSIPQALGAELTVIFPCKFDAVIMPNTCIKVGKRDERMLLRTRDGIKATIKTELAVKLEIVMRAFNTMNDEDKAKGETTLNNCIAQNDRYDIIRAAAEIGFKLDIDAICNKAASVGSLQCLQYVRDTGFALPIEMAQKAVAGGHLECLKLIHKAGVTLDISICQIAATSGYVDCLSYAFTSGAPCDSTVSSMAANDGHLDCFKYLHESGCAWDGKTCKAATANGHLDCLIYAHENGCAWSKSTCKAAAMNDQLACLRYAHENGCPCSESACNMALLYEQLACTKYLIDNGCELSSISYYYAVHGGSLDCLKYLHENDHKIAIDDDEQTWREGHGGAMWDSGVIRLASDDGNLDCLTYLHENGCPWDNNVCEGAKRNGHVKCVEYVHLNGCGCDCEKD